MRIEWTEELDEWEIDEIIDEIDESCGTGKPLSLAAKQDVRLFFEQLRRAIRATQA